MRITAEQCVKALKARNLSTTAKRLAEYMGETQSRAVATALRNPVKDGRVKVCFSGGLTYYRFVRLKAKVAA
jgi:hypothetical protein